LHQKIGNKTLQQAYIKLVLLSGQTAFGGMPKPEILLFTEADDVVALAKGALRRFTQ